MDKSIEHQCKIVLRNVELSDLRAVELSCFSWKVVVRWRLRSPKQNRFGTRASFKQSEMILSALAKIEAVLAVCRCADRRGLFSNTTAQRGPHRPTRPASLGSEKAADRQGACDGRRLHTGDRQVKGKPVH